MFPRVSILLASALLLGLAPAPLPRKATVGQPAPDFKLKTFAKENVALADLRGQVVVLNLWATWCVPCKAEMPMMDAYFRKHRDKGLRIYGVQTEDSVPNYKLKEVSAVLSYPLTLQFRGSAYPILDGVPTTYVIDRKGVVRYAEARAFNHQSFDALIRPLLEEAP